MKFCDLLFDAGKSRSVAAYDVKFTADQKEFVHDLMTYACSHEEKSFKAALDESIGESRSQELIRGGIGIAFLQEILFKAELYPQKEANLVYLASILFPDPERLLNAIVDQNLLKEEVAAEEVSILGWKLFEDGLKDFHNMPNEFRVKMLEHLLNVFVEAIMIGSEMLATKALRSTSQLFGKGFPEEIINAVSAAIIDVAGDISKGSEDPGIIRRLGTLKTVVNQLCEPLPPDPLVLAAIRVFELDYPYRPELLKILRDDLKKSCAAILAGLSVEDLEMRLRNSDLYGSIFFRIDIVGCLFYDRNFKNQEWCVQEFIKMIKEMEDDDSIGLWAARTKAHRFREILAKFGITEENLGAYFKNPKHVEKIKRIWGTPPSKREGLRDSSQVHDLENLPEKDQG